MKYKKAAKRNNSFVLKNMRSWPHSVISETFLAQNKTAHTRQLSLTLLRQEGHRAIHIKH